MLGRGARDQQSLLFGPTFTEAGKVFHPHPTPREFATDFLFKQECIPVGCVPSAAVAITGGGEVSAWGVSAQEEGGVCAGGVCPGKSAQ